MGTTSARRVPVREIATRRTRAADTFELRTLSAQLTVSERALPRLLRLSGSYTDFILSSADGSTTVRVGLMVSDVPLAEVALGRSNVVVNWSRATLTRGTKQIPLTRMELRLLAALYENAGAPVDRDVLAFRLWPNRVPNPESMSALPVLVCSLRKRLRSVGLIDAVRTVRGAGYCFAV
jgi:DNA-binding response OmpR family regulator